MASTTKFRQPSKLAQHRLSEDQTVVLSPTHTAVVLNEVGMAVLELCDGSRSVDELVAILCESLQGAQRDRVETDVREFIEALTKSGCLVGAP